MTRQAASRAAASAAGTLEDSGRRYPRQGVRQDRPRHDCTPGIGQQGWAPIPADGRLPLDRRHRQQPGQPRLGQRRHGPAPHRPRGLRRRRLGAGRGRPAQRAGHQQHHRGPGRGGHHQRPGAVGDDLRLGPVPRPRPRPDPRHLSEEDPEGVLSGQFNIPVPAGDPSFDPAGTGTQVIPLTRSSFDPATGTGADNPRQQVNVVTAWIDGSQVYGSDAEVAAKLRTFVGRPAQDQPGAGWGDRHRGRPAAPEQQHLLPRRHAADGQRRPRRARRPALRGRRRAGQREHRADHPAHPVRPRAQPHRRRHRPGEPAAWTTRRSTRWPAPRSSPSCRRSPTTSGCPRCSGRGRCRRTAATTRPSTPASPTSSRPPRSASATACSATTSSSSTTTACPSPRSSR